MIGKILAFLTIFVAPILFMLLVSFIGERIGGNGGGDSGNDKCSDPMGSYDC